MPAPGPLLPRSLDRIFAALDRLFLPLVRVLIGDTPADRSASVAAEVTDPTMHSTGGTGVASVTSSQIAAWHAANHGYHAGQPELYRAYARELYALDLRDRLRILLAKLDEQNTRLDGAMSQGAGKQGRCAGEPPAIYRAPPQE